MGHKPNALVVDFFAGSGTSAHAVMRLNRQDGGSRQCICITNNEVSREEEVRFRKKGLRPGDPDWEAGGICEYITKPRIAAAVTGKTPDGSRIEGDYKFIDEFPIAEGFEENVEFFTMTYEAPRPVAHNRAFEVIAPLLWIRAGSQGRRIEKASHDFDVADTYAVLFDLDASRDFLAAVAEAETLRIAFIVTDDDGGVPGGVRRAARTGGSRAPLRVVPHQLHHQQGSGVAVRYTLKDYQEDAVGEVLTHLTRARRDWHRWESPVAFSLTATTGAGKTVMAAAVIEALFHGNPAYEFDSDPGAGRAVVHRRPFAQRADPVSSAGRRGPNRSLALGGHREHLQPGETRTG